MTKRPNLLIVMVDQLTGTLFPDGPAPFLHAPNLRRMAEHSLKFTNCYTASPICAPARASLLSGLPPSQTRVYDNGSELVSDIPTYAHLLRNAGYQTSLAGKMHFVGPDQLHGFEERLTPDDFPADFGWTPEHTGKGQTKKAGHLSLHNVMNAGVNDAEGQFDYDDDVAFQAVQKLYQLSRNADPRPWCLTVSFAHPSGLFSTQQKYWDLYKNAPEVVAPHATPYAELDPHSQKLMDMVKLPGASVTADDTQRARQAYFANISYIDEKIGQIFSVLEESEQDATVIFISDHGEMLGERGLWFPMNFFENAARVPLMIYTPSCEPQTLRAPVSTLDLCPTLCRLAGIDAPSIAPWIEGNDLIALARGATPSVVAMEYAADGASAPIVALREGAWKYIVSAPDGEMLFDLASDPKERQNLVDEARAAPILAHFRTSSQARWDLESFGKDVSQSRMRRRFVHNALNNGAYFPWDYKPLRAASERYMRNHISLQAAPETRQYAS